MVLQLSIDELEAAIKQARQRTKGKAEVLNITESGFSFANKSGNSGGIFAGRIELKLVKERHEYTPRNFTIRPNMEVEKNANR